MTVEELNQMLDDQLKRMDGHLSAMGMSKMSPQERLRAENRITDGLQALITQQGVNTPTGLTVSPGAPISQQPQGELATLRSPQRPVPPELATGLI